MGQKIASSLSVPSNVWKMKIGTADRKKHNTIFFEFSSFISPITENCLCSDDMDCLRRYIREETNKMIEKTGFFKNNFILNFQIPDTRMCVGKNSYLLIQIFLKCMDEELLNRQFNTIDQLLGNVRSEFGGKLTNKLTDMNYCQYTGRYQK